MLEYYPGAEFFCALRMIPLQYQKSLAFLTRVRVISIIMMVDFEWDPTKAAANERKHGVGFEEAVLAFDDLFAVEWIDGREDYGEERFILLGMSKGVLLAVAYTERGDRIRIISAHKASKNEQDRYLSENGRQG